jgi:hypothetical protein
MTTLTNREIIYIIETKLTDNDLKKYGSEFFKKNSFNLYFYNVAPITRKNYYNNYNNDSLPTIENQKFFFKPDDLIQEIRKEKNPIIFTIIASHNKIQNKIFYNLNKNKISYISIHSSKLPYDKITKLELLFLSIIYPLAALRKIKKKILTFQSKYFYPTSTLRNNSLNNSESDKNNFNIPSYDYDEIIKWERNGNHKELTNDNNYYVFIETPYSHPDGLFANDRFPPEKPCNFEDWYKPLNNFYAEFCKIMKTNILIIPHPRTTKKALDALEFGNIVDPLKKIDYIKNSRGLLTFHSLALSYGVYFNKPIIFLDQNNFTFHNRRSINSVAKYFKKKSINMSKKINNKILEEALNIDLKSYENFKIEYLGYPSSKTSHEIIRGLINKNYI